MHQHIDGVCAHRPFPTKHNDLEDEAVMPLVINRLGL